MVRTFQDARLFAGLTAAENVRVACEGRRRRSPGIPEDRYDLLELCGLLHQADTAGRDLPYGDQRRLGVAMALASHPELLLLDEPAVGLSSEERQRLATLLLQVREMGVATFIVEHDMNFLMNLVEVVTVLAAGRKIFEGTPEEVRRSDEVADAYLGRAGDEGDRGADGAVDH